MTAPLVYATSGLAGAALGALAGTTGHAAPHLLAAAPFVVLSAVRRSLVAQVLGIAVLVGMLTWHVAALHGERSAALLALARGIPRCALAGTAQERFGTAGMVVAASLRCEDGTTSGSRVYARLTAAPGARVEGTGWLVPVDAGEGFDEMRARAGLSAEFHFEEFALSPPSGAFAAAETFRSSLRDVLADDARGELALGLTIGETDRFSPSDTEALRAAGLSHLVAVSGSNVAIVLAAIGAVFAWASRRARLAAALLGLGAFVLVVGPEPSVLRAAAMAGVALGALAAGSRADPASGLLLAVTVLLILRPPLVWSVGLHLSAAATAGIVLWSRRFEAALGALPALVRTPLAVTLAAQAAVTPVLLLTFGALSLVAPLSNVLAAPAVAPATILALLAACLHPWFPEGALVVAGAAEATCGWILAVGRALGSSGWAEVTVPAGAVPPLAALAAIALLAAVCVPRDD